MFVVVRMTEEEVVTCSPGGERDGNERVSQFSVTPLNQVKFPRNNTQEVKRFTGELYS